MSPQIKRERSNRIEVLELSRPPVNALDLSLVKDLGDIFAEIGADPRCGAIVLTGAGSTFCAGLDLKLIPKYNVSEQRQLLDALNRMFLAIYSCPLPVVCAINGHAIAGGMVLALCCDFRMVAEVPLQAALAEVKAAVPYPIAALEIARKELSPRDCRRLVILGESLSREEALNSGIFDRCDPAERLLETAIAQARQFSELPRSAFATIKRQLRQPALTVIETAIAENSDPLRHAWLSEETVRFASLQIAQDTAARKHK